VSRGKLPEVNRSGFEKTKSKNFKKEVDLKLGMIGRGVEWMICSKGGDDRAVEIG
jgi:hypothetical protein